MRLRTILIVLSLLAFLSASSGGYLYYTSLKESANKDVERQAYSYAETIKNHTSLFLYENLKSARVLAGLEELQDVLINVNNNALLKVNAILDHFNQALQVDVCYLMDREGDTIASSNREAPDSFVGINYAFRPYFQKAIQGESSIYMALGVTSKKRGVYYSYPVYADINNPPIGVTVIKASIEPIENEFNKIAQGIIMITDPRGVIFITNRKEWLYHLVWELPQEEISMIAASQQFGNGSWTWIGLKELEGNKVSDQSGNEYLAYKMSFDIYPGWNMIYLVRFQTYFEKVSHPLIKASGYLILIFCFIIGLAVSILYKKANDEIFRRLRAEEELGAAKEELSQYSKNLERQVEGRTREIKGILKNTPNVVYIKDREGRYTLINSRFEELFGLKNADVYGKRDEAIFPKEVAERLKTNDHLVLAGNYTSKIEESIPQDDGMHTHLSIKFPLYDENRTVYGLCGISTDITALKRAQDQLRRLSGRIMDSQEKERTAIARELHDELGQILTALRMDAIWIKDHLGKADPRATDRISRICHLIDKTIDDVRGIAIRLRPGVLDDLGLTDALEWFTAEFEKRSGIVCIFNHHNIPFLKNIIATAAYRITQEALTNVARHSFASHVDVGLRTENGTLILNVEDNGVGFNAHCLSDNCLGIAGMQERAGLVGGHLEIKSRPGKGTKVHFIVPMNGRGEKVS